MLEKRTVKCFHSCLLSDNLICSNVTKTSCDNGYSYFGDNVRYFSHKYNIASMNWIIITDIIPHLFDHRHSSNPYLLVAHTIRELYWLLYWQHHCVHM